MTEPQSPFPPLGAVYAEVQTGRTVRAATLVRLAQMADVLASARPGKRAMVQSAYPNGASARTYALPYTRTSDAIGYLVVRAHQRYGVATDRLTLDLTIRDSAGHSVASSSDLVPVDFRVGTEHVMGGYSASTIASGYLDLDALAATLADPDWSLEFDVALSHGSGSLVDLIEVYEVPRSVVDAADTYGSLTGALMPGRPLTSGPIAAPDDDGVARLRQTLAGARLAQRTWWQECFGPDDTSAALVPSTAAGSYAALSQLEESAGVPTAIVLRVRKITGASAGEYARVRVRYLVTGGGSARVKITSSVGGHISTALTSSSWVWSDWWTVRLKSTGAGQLETLTMTAKTTAGTLYVSGLVIDEATT